MVLRSVRTEQEGVFTPHLSLSIAILLAFLCVSVLVYFVGHMARRISVETVIDLVSQEMQATMITLTSTETQNTAPPQVFWHGGVAVLSDDSGYLQELDCEGLADWAAEHGTALHLLIRAGNYVYPGATVAIATSEIEGAQEAVRNATALGPVQTASADPEFIVGRWSRWRSGRCHRESTIPRRPRRCLTAWDPLCATWRPGNCRPASSCVMGGWRWSSLLWTTAI